MDGLPSNNLMKSLSGATLLILDDLMSEFTTRRGESDCMRRIHSARVFITGARFLERAFCQTAHHGAAGAGVSVIAITQDMYYCSALKTARLNASLLALFDTPADKLWAYELSRRMYPWEPLFLGCAYDDAIKIRYTCLLVNMKECDDLRVTSSCAGPGPVFVYKPFIM